MLKMTMTFYLLKPHKFLDLQAPVIVRLSEAKEALTLNGDDYAIPEEFFSYIDNDNNNYYSLLDENSILDKDAQKLLLQLLNKRKNEEASYTELIRQLEKKDILSGFLSASMEHDESIVQYIATDKDNLTSVYRFVMNKFDKYDQVLSWCKRAYPNLLFTDDAFSAADKIGTWEENRSQIQKALSALNEIKVSDHGFAESEALGYLQAKTGIECTGKGRGENQTFKKNVKWTDNDDKKGVGYKRKAISCIPHFKLDKSYSNKRIYFNWGLKEILDGKIIVVHVGEHWDETVNKHEAEIM